MNDMILRGLPGAELVKIGDQSVYVLKHQPTQGDVHVNGVLTNVAIRYMQSPDAFVADRVFPNVPVAKQSDLYRIYDRSFWFRAEMEKVAPNTEAKQIGYEMSTTSYFCHVYGLAHLIADQVRANADSDINLELNATQLLSQQALLRRELAWASSYFTTGVWTSGRVGVSVGEVAGTSVRQWNDANSSPIEDIRLAKRTIQGLTAILPNKLTVGREVYDSLIDHPDIVDRVKYSTGTADNPSRVNRRTLAALFEIDELLVMDSLQNTAKEGQTLAMSRIGGKSALLTFSPSGASADMPSAGYNFSWTGYTGASAQGVRMLRYRNQPKKSDVIEMEMSFDPKVTAPDLGFFFSTIVA